MLLLLIQQTPFEMLDSTMFKDDLTYDDTTAFKKDFSSADDGDDANEFYCKDGKVRISAAIYFVILKTSFNLILNMFIFLLEHEPYRHCQVL